MSSQGPIKFPESVGGNLSTASISLSNIVKVLLLFPSFLQVFLKNRPNLLKTSNVKIKVLSVFGRSVVVLATSNPAAGVPAAKIQEALHSAIDAVTEFGDMGIQFLTNTLTSILGKLTTISTAVQNGEYDFDGTKLEPPVPPVHLRAEQVQAEIRDATGLKYKIESKDLDIKVKASLGFSWRIYSYLCCFFAGVEKITKDKTGGAERNAS